MITANPPHTSELQRIIRVMFGRWVVIIGTAIILALIVVAIFAPLLAPYDPNEQHLTRIRVSPGNEFKLGTDDLGRDVLSRLIFGSRISMLVGIVAITIAGIVGISLGLIAGYYGGWTQSVIGKRCPIIWTTGSLVEILMELPRSP